MQLTIQQHLQIADHVFQMRLQGDTREIKKAGQFVQVQLPDFYLRRPISVCDFIAKEDGMLTLVYKVVGKGTEAMSKMPVGTKLDVLMGLGNGYDTTDNLLCKQSQFPLLVGGGVGVPPLYALCKSLITQRKEPTVCLGFNTKEDVFYKEAFEALGVKVLINTVDGSMGEKGFVTDSIKNQKNKYDYIYTCGPEPMLKAVHSLVTEQGVSGQYSFEERMACGFGACMGCSCKTKYGNKRICKEGPVLFSEEIQW